MADSSGGSDGKKNKNGKVVGGIGLGVVGCIINAILNFMDKGIKINQIIKFINSWPVVLAMIFLSIAWVSVKYIHEENKTKRVNIDAEQKDKCMKEEETKRKDLEKQLKEANSKIREAHQEKVKLEEKAKVLEEKVKELEVKVKESNEEKNKSLKMSIELVRLEEKIKFLEEKINVFEWEKDQQDTERENVKQSLNKKGGQGEAARFLGKNRANA